MIHVTEKYAGEDADLMVALHAWRSAGSIRDFRAKHPDRPVVLALTGTDIYAFQYSHPAETLESMAAADWLVSLHDRVATDIPAAFSAKLTAIPQSAPPLPQPRAPSKRHFDVCVVGHLRSEKDSLRAAYAVRDLPAESRLRVIHLGKAHDEEWARMARDEMARNPRYLWRGEVPGWRVRREYARTHAMVMSSVMEGGANVVSEAIVAGVPVLASDISGNIGMLGEDYPGYYPCEDTAGLRALLVRVESDPDFLEDLTRHCIALASRYTPEVEAAGWRAVIARVTGSA